MAEASLHSQCIRQDVFCRFSEACLLRRLRQRWCLLRVHSGGAGVGVLGGKRCVSYCQERDVEGRRVKKRGLFGKPKRARGKRVLYGWYKEAGLTTQSWMSWVVWGEYTAMGKCCYIFNFLNVATHHSHLSTFKDIQTPRPHPWRFLFYRFEVRSGIWSSQEISSVSDTHGALGISAQD